MIGQLGAEYAHRMTNVVGSIPVRVNLIKENLPPAALQQPVVVRELEGILSDTDHLLRAAVEMWRTTDQSELTDVSVNDLLETAIEHVWVSLPTLAGLVEVKKHFVANLPSVHLEKRRLLYTLESIIRNGLEAMPQGGILTVCTRQALIREQPCVEICISDTGVGIPATQMPEVFDLFFTTKMTGLGFGLWRDQMYVRGLGGTIELESSEGEGTTVTVKIPVMSRGEEDSEVRRRMA